MKHALGILLAFLCFSTPVWAQTSWKGQAEVWSDPSLPLDGYFAATDQFPRNTILIVESYQTHKTVQVRVTSSLPLGSPSLVVLSPKAAAALGMEQGESVPVSVQIDNSLEGYLASGNDKTWNPDSEVSPSLSTPSNAEPAATTAPPAPTPTPAPIPTPSTPLVTKAEKPVAPSPATPSPSPAPLPTSDSLPAVSAPLPLPVPAPLPLPPPAPAPVVVASTVSPTATVTPTPTPTPTAAPTPVAPVGPAPAPVAVPPAPTSSDTPAEVALALALAPPLPPASAVAVPGPLSGPILGNVSHVTSLKGKSYVQLAAFVKETDLLRALSTIKSYVPLTVMTKTIGKVNYFILVATAPRSQLGVLLLLFQQEGYLTAFAVQG